MQINFDVSAINSDTQAEVRTLTAVVVVVVVLEQVDRQGSHILVVEEASQKEDTEGTEPAEVQAEEGIAVGTVVVVGSTHRAGVVLVVVHRQVETVVGMHNMVVVVVVMVMVQVGMNLPK